MQPDNLGTCNHPTLVKWSSGRTVSATKVHSEEQIQVGFSQPSRLPVDSSVFYSISLPLWHILILYSTVPSIAAVASKDMAASDSVP
jgi:hypothetical protein